ncbi:MAG: hypothetical protein MZW92_57315 [Comamonadaceae bacterium]|nr:hypothetical protein [Comamonadaceae bacterium]
MRQAPATSDECAAVGTCRAATRTSPSVVDWRRSSALARTRQVARRVTASAADTALAHWN